MRTLGCVLSIAVAAVLAGCGESTWMSRDFTTATASIDTVSILSPFIEYSIKNGTTKKVKAPHSRFVSGKVAEVFKTLIDSGEFVSSSAVIISDSITEEQWHSGEYIRWLTLFRHLSDSLLEAKGNSKKLPRIPELHAMIERIPTRYFLFICGNAFGTTEDSKLVDMMQSQMLKLFYDRPFLHESQWSGLELKLFLIDKATNEILWCTASDPRDTIYDPGKGAEIESLCRKLLHER